MKILKKCPKEVKGYPGWLSKKNYPF